MEDVSLTQTIQSIISSVCKNSTDVDVLVDKELLVFIIKGAYMYTSTIPGNDLRFGFSYTKLIADGIPYAELIADDDIFLKVYQVYSKYQNMINSRNPDAQISDLRAFEDYVNKTQGLKSTDGAKFIFIPGIEYNKRYLYPVFTGYPVISKSDSVGLSIYDIDSKRYLGVTSIYKKKLKKQIDLFVRYINMDRSLNMIC